MFSSHMLADAIALAHALFAMFIIFGLALIITGIFFRWDWVKNGWFRALHLSAMLLLMFRVWSGSPCPMSVYEDRFRAQAKNFESVHNWFYTFTHKMAARHADPVKFAVAVNYLGWVVILMLFVSRPKLRLNDSIRADEGNERARS